MHRFLHLILWLLPLTAFAQDQIFGSWQGKMSSLQGKYIFNLDILPNFKEGNSTIKGTAIHDRNGAKEVIELIGILYSDQSIYLSDVANPDKKIEVGETFSKLQFLLKYESGILVLDGHWQEYEDLHRYRKGRLVLRKRKSKA
ncbi:MAG: hypothetical protein HKN76_13360 [Saprospiraceae bacterium]|nr:hypothetical protein [Saprospiraceae bacterium]